MRSSWSRIALVLCALALAPLSFAADFEVYRAIGGKKNSTCWTGPDTAPSQFRFDIPDGLSTFQSGTVQGADKPYRVRFVVTGVANSPPHDGDSGPVTDLANFTATFTPLLGAGHWSINSITVPQDEKKNKASEYARANLAVRVSRNPDYVGALPYCPGAPLARKRLYKE